MFFRSTVVLLSILNVALAETFVLPTPNRAIFKPGAEEEYFVPTPGKTWVSGTFGCVRTGGNQIHEGLDIKCVRRGARGEPSDPIYATANGRVAYLNSSAGLSNYGKYILLEHQIEGIKIFSFYAHLSSFAEGLRAGDNVKQGEVIATMGRTSNTRSAISKERAHLHFEITLRLNSRYAAWHKVKLAGQRNDHGNYNGKNFVGIDPRAVFLEQEKLGSKFSLLSFIRSRSELCRVTVRDTRFPFLQDYAPLVRRNPLAEEKGVVGYEIALDFNGVPFQLIPRSAAELKTNSRLRLLSVDSQEHQSASCRDLVLRRKGNWDLANAGIQLLDLLIY